jgi:Integrase zinc binding domain
MLEILHITHAGIVRTKSVARSYMWWPGMDSDIEQEIKACVPCGMVKASPPWPRIHVDFGGPIMGKYIWIAVDAYSKWVEASATNQLTTKIAIEKLMEICGLAWTTIFHKRSFTEGTSSFQKHSTQVSFYKKNQVD